MNSMTGFASSEFVGEEFSIKLQLSSLNSKNISIYFISNLPLGELEFELRKLIKKNFLRGTFSVRLDLLLNNQASAWEINEKKLSFLLKTLRSFKLEGETIDIANLLSLPDIIIENNKIIENEFMREKIFSLFHSVCRKLSENRQEEGSNINGCLQKYFEKLKDLLKLIKNDVAKNELTYKEKFSEKLFPEQLDKNRIEEEVLIFLNKVSIQEEVDRLDSHFLRFKKLLTIKGKIPIGKEFDFLLVEMMREFNTISAKSIVLEIKDNVISAKAILENCREQIANIE